MAAIGATNLHIVRMVLVECEAVAATLAAIEFDAYIGPPFGGALIGLGALNHNTSYRNAPLSSIWKICG